MNQQEFLSISERLLNDYMQGWNHRNPDQFAESLHFPSVRINGDNQIQVFTSKDDIKNLFEKLAAREDLIRSQWLEATIIQASEKKIHIACSFSRQFKEGEIAGPFHSFYILTFEQGRWGVRFRSSFHS